eukprot:1044919-Pyramimonas_sp.AAC.1
MDIELKADDSPLESPTGMMSDHKIMFLRIRPAHSKPVQDQPVPAFLSDSPHYAHHYEKLSARHDLSRYDPVHQWRFQKSLMHEAARLTRNTLTKIPTAELDSQNADISKEICGMTLRSIARAVWNQNKDLACTLRNNTEVGRKYLQIDGDSVKLIQPVDYTNETLDTHSSLAEERRARAAANAR